MFGLAHRTVLLAPAEDAFDHRAQAIALGSGKIGHSRILRIGLKSELACHVPADAVMGTARHKRREPFKTQVVFNRLPAADRDGGSL